MNTNSLKVLATSASVLLAVLVLAAAAAAQDRPSPAGEFAAGALLFGDDGIVSESFVGGTGRVYVLPRVSLGPEIAFISGNRHSHLMLTGNVTFDFLGPVNGRPRAVTPFAVVGGGLFQTREEFPSSETFTSSEGGFTAGGGVRALVGKQITLGAEARIGWEAHFRLNGTVGVRLGPATR